LIDEAAPTGSPIRRRSPKDGSAIRPLRILRSAGEVRPSAEAGAGRVRDA